MTSFQARINGVIPALLTPLNQDFTVDVDGLRRLTRRVLDAGCHGVVVLGTTGEFGSIDDDQREVAIRACVEATAGAAPVIVGCGQPNVRRVHDQVRAAGELGADAVLVNPPFYFPLTQDEVLRYFEGIVAASPVPVLLYNIPTLTKVATEPATLRRLLELGLEGTKDSTGDVNNLMAYLDAVSEDPDFRVIVGGDAFFLHALNSGACATTGMTPNLAPQLNLGIYQAWRAGDLAGAAAVQNRCNAYLRTFLSQGGFPHATAKAVLSKLEVIQPWVAPPKTGATPAGAERAFEALRDYLPEFEPAPAAI